MLNEIHTRELHISKVSSDQWHVRIHMQCHINDHTRMIPIHFAVYNFEKKFSCVKNNTTLIYIAETEKKRKISYI